MAKENTEITPEEFDQIAAQAGLTLDPEDPSRYQTPSGWAQFESRSETFQVRFGSPLTRDYLRKIVADRKAPAVPIGLSSWMYSISTSSRPPSPKWPMMSSAR